MLTIRYESLFKKDYKRIIKRGYDKNLLETVLNILVSGQTLPSKYKDHSLCGNYENCRECHITSDWLMIYQLNPNDMVLYLIRTGSHSDLF